MEPKSIDAKRNGSGKGAEFVTRKNPFVPIIGTSTRPALGDVQMLGIALDKILESECAIIIGQTRDGGALVLTILDGEERHRTYCSNERELDQAISAIVDIYGKP